MKKLSLLCVVVVLFLTCEHAICQTGKGKKIEFNQRLADELKTMAEVDQVAAYIPQGKYKDWTPEKWNNFKDSVFTTHKKRLEEIFEKFGYPGYDLVGKMGAYPKNLADSASVK